MAAIFCILDGMTGEGLEQTALPGLQRIKEEGAWGYFDTVPAGFAAESMNCIFTLLGLLPRQVPRHGRAYLEALGAGLPVAQGDLVLRGSWLRVSADGVVQGFENTPPPINAAGADVRYYPLGGYKSLLVVPGWGAGLAQLQTTAPHEAFGAQAQALGPQGCPPLEAFCRAAKNDGALLVPWGQAAGCRVPRLYAGGAAVCGAQLVRGMAQVLGMQLPTVAGFTGDVDTDLDAKLQAALQAAAKASFVLLHINGGDEAGHRKNLAEKTAFAHRVDAQLLRPLAQSGHSLLVCADHSTPVATGMHGDEPQPFFLKNRRHRGFLGSHPGYSAVQLLGVPLPPPA